MKRGETPCARHNKMAKYRKPQETRNSPETGRPRARLASSALKSRDRAEGGGRPGGGKALWYQRGGRLSLVSTPESVAPLGLPWVQKRFRPPVDVEQQHRESYRSFLAHRCQLAS